MHIAIARDNPRVLEASNPEPIAKPSGKLWIVRPIPIIIPAFKRLELEPCFIFNFLFTKSLQIIIVPTPVSIPNIEPWNRYKL